MKDYQKEAEAEQIPGVCYCPLCNFILVKNVLYTKSGTIGVDNTPFVERCPNDGQIMKPQTYKKAYEEMVSMCEQQVKRAVEAELKLEQLHLPERLELEDAVRKLFLKGAFNHGDDCNCYGCKLKSALAKLDKAKLSSPLPKT
jgi:hypothetical protein